MKKLLQGPTWRGGFWLDVGLAGLFTTLGLLELATSPTFEGIVDPPLVLFILMQTAFLGLRRRFPLSVHLIASLGLAFQVSDYPMGLSTDATLITLYSAAAYSSWRGAGMALVVTLADIVWVINRIQGWDAWAIVETSVVWVGVFGLGVFFRLQQARSERRTRQLAELEQERIMFRQNAVAEERGRMARELHDSVGHSVTGIVMLAGALRSVEDRPDVVREAVGSIERSGLDAMAELEALIGLLRDEDGDGEMARQPGLRNLERLFAGAAAVGLEVDSDIADTEPLPPAIDRAAFRIVQEALTNASKYANPGRVSVTIRNTGPSIEIEVVNPVLVESRSTILSGGRGLIGMDERVTILGGTFAASQTGSVFRVLAQLPLAAHAV